MSPCSHTICFGVTFSLQLCIQAFAIHFLNACFTCYFKFDHEYGYRNSNPNICLSVFKQQPPILCQERELQVLSFLTLGNKRHTITGVLILDSLHTTATRYGAAFWRHVLFVPVFCFIVVVLCFHAHCASVKSVTTLGPGHFADYCHIHNTFSTCYSNNLIMSTVIYSHHIYLSEIPQLFK